MKAFQTFSFQQTALQLACAFVIGTASGFVGTILNQAWIGINIK
jgi:large-conductance mechanosensitive channel